MSRLPGEAQRHRRLRAYASALREATEDAFLAGDIPQATALGFDLFGVLKTLASQRQRQGDRGPGLYRKRVDRTLDQCHDRAAAILRGGLA